VLPYGSTRESASGAIRYPLACGRATITTREKIFDDVRDTVLQIPDNAPESIAGAIERVLTDDGLRRELEERARRYAVETSWPRVAAHHLQFYREVRMPEPASRSLAASG
jgi:glycosyltransferase involved in cell wall biosynthesis